MKNLNELVEKHKKKIQIRSKLFLLKLKNITIENEVEFRQFRYKFNKKKEIK